MEYNLHTHTPRCHHAEGDEEAYILKAIQAGIKVLGFSDHSPMPFPGEYCSGFRMELEAARDYFDTLTVLKDKYRHQITILLGVEAEYYPAIYPRMMDFLSLFPIEYMIMGQHFIDNEYDTGLYSGNPDVDEKWLAKYVDQVLEGLSKGSYTYLAHPDLIRYPSEDPAFTREMTRLCVGCKELSIPLEINLLGLGDHRHYPSRRFWEIAGQVGCDVVIGIDAHTATCIGDQSVLDKALELASTYHLHLLEKVEIRDPLKAWRECKSLSEPFETDRLLLRPWNTEDAESLFRYASDPDIGLSCGWPPHTSIEDSRTVLKNVLIQPMTFAVVLKETGMPIGSMGIFPTTSTSARSGELEIGYWIGKAYWGQGLIPEAVREATNRIFTLTSSDRIFCGYFDGNHASHRVQEKCGFVYDHSETVFWAPLGKDKLVHFTILTR